MSIVFYTNIYTNNQRKGWCFMKYSIEEYYAAYHIFFWQNSTKYTPDEEGTLLKIIRRFLGYSQSEMANALDVSVSFISLMENGRKIISYTTKLRIVEHIITNNQLPLTSNLYDMSNIVSEIIANNVYNINFEYYNLEEIIQKARLEMDNIKTDKESKRVEKYNNHWVASPRKSFVVKPNYFDVEKVNKALWEISHNQAEPISLKEEMLFHALKSSLEITEHRDELIEILHKSLMDITSFMNDIDIIRRYDLETTLDRISRSIRKMLRDSYNTVRKDENVEILGYVGAGQPYDYIEIRDIITVPDKTNIDFGLIIRGDSMSPAYSDGDVVFVRKQDTLENSECGIFQIGDKRIFKKFHRSEDGKIYLKSLNKNYKDIIVNEDTDNFKIIGKVYMGR